MDVCGKRTPTQLRAKNETRSPLKLACPYGLRSKHEKLKRQHHSPNNSRLQTTPGSNRRKKRTKLSFHPCCYRISDKLLPLFIRHDGNDDRNAGCNQQRPSRPGPGNDTMCGGALIIPDVEPFGALTFFFSVFVSTVVVAVVSGKADD